MNQVDSTQAWSKGIFTCYDCLEVIDGDMLVSQNQKLCVSCVEKTLLSEAQTVNLDEWSIPQLLEALDDGEVISRRLIVLRRFEDVLMRVHKETPDQGRQFLNLLVRNLGYVRDHSLAQSVRQAAYDICCKIGEPLTPVLIDSFKTTPWQYYANIAMALDRINPTHPEALPILRKAAQDPRPEIRQRVTSIQAPQPPVAVTAKPVAKTGGPNIRRKRKAEHKTGSHAGDSAACMMEVGKASNSQTKSARSAELEAMFNTLYSAVALQQLYRNYLQDVDFPDDQFRLDTRIAANKLKKAQISRIMAAICLSSLQFKTFFEQLPQPVRDIFLDLVWNKGEREVSQLEKQYGIRMVKNSPRLTAGPNALEGVYALFQVRSQYKWQEKPNQPIYQHHLSIPDQLRSAVKPHLPKPKGYDLQPLLTIEPTAFVHEGRDRVLRDLKLYLGYIGQGNLGYSKSTGKVLKYSLVQMAKHCRIEEFFPEQSKELQYVKTALIIDFLTGVVVDTEPSPERILQQLFSDFFNDSQPKSKQLREYLFDRKSDTDALRDSGRHKQLKKSLLMILKALPDDRWIDIEGLEKYCSYRDIDLNVVGFGFALAIFRIIQNQKRYQYLNSIDALKSISGESEKKQFLRTMFFLFAAFDLLDIAYDPPSQKKPGDKIKFHARFEGLRYVRITPLGSYVLGRTKTYENVVEAPKARIQLDDKRLLIILEGYDPLKTIALEKLAEKIGHNCYRVSSESFLRGCLNRKHIEERITLFHEQIEKDPPPLWQRFFDNLQQKSNPLTKKTGYVVFRLQPDKELIALMARDEILKEHILKAEDYHVLIDTKHLGKVKNRLRAFGYFTDNL